jgi:hypothetical protein
MRHMIGLDMIGLGFGLGIGLGLNWHAQQAALAVQQAKAGNQTSLAKFKEFMAQQGRANLTQEELAKLDAQFQEWNRRSKN